MASPYLREELERFSQGHRLTPREHDVLFLLLTGLGTVPEIAKHLSLSGNTVHNHFKNIFRRTATNTKAGLLALFLRHALERHAALSAFVRRPRVLVVDADAAECERVCSALASYGLDATAEREIGAVLPRIAERRIDVVVVDAASGEGRAEALRSAVQERFGARPAVLPMRLGKDVDGRRPSGSEGVRGALPLDQLCFSILEAIADSPYDRSRLLRVEAELPVRFDDGQQASTGNVGFGGAFVSLGARSAGDGALRYAVGSRINLACALDDQRPMKLFGEVRWRSQSTRPGQVDGMGVRFVDLAEDQRQKLEDFVRRRKLESLQRLASLAPPDRRP